MAPWVLLVIVFWLGDTGRKKIWNHRFEYDDYKFHIEEIVACEVTVAERQLFLELVQDLLLGIDEDIYESTKRVVQSPTLSKITFVRELHANELHRRS